MRRWSYVPGLLLVVEIAFSCSLAWGQAWVPEAGQASVSLYYERGVVSTHLFSGDVIGGGVNFGRKVDLGRIQAQSLHLSIDYGISNKLAVSVALPASVSKYTGSDPENPATDDGQFRGGLQDFRFEARYMALEDPVVVTPSLAAVVPSHEYSTFGHVALGRRLKELHAALYLGKLLTFISDDLVAEAGYDFAYTEKVGDTRPNRSHFDFGLSYFITPTVTVSTYAAFVITHAGMDWLEEMNEISFTDHDRMAKARFIQIGGTISYDVSDAFRIFVGYSSIAWGENTHQIQSFAIGSTWSLQVFE